MTPKEEAKKLVQIFARLHRGLDDTFQLGDVWFDELDKQCALICVDRIIASCFHPNLSYWQEVKQEIEKV